MRSALIHKYFCKVRQYKIEILLEVQNKFCQTLEIIAYNFLQENYNFQATKSA